MSAAAQDLYRDEFRRSAASLPGQHVPWLQAMRKEALDYFLAEGFPTARQEDWKYTSLRTLQRRHFRLSGGCTEVAGGDIRRFLLAGVEACNLVFVDGLWMPGLSSVEQQPHGVTIASLARVLDDEPDALTPWFGRLIDIQQPGFAALTTSLMRDGAVIQLADNVACDRPVHLVFISSGKEGDMMPVRNLVVAGDGSEGTVIESHVFLRGGEHLSTAVNEIVVGKGAQLTHYRIVDDSNGAYHFSDSAVTLEENARYIAHSVSNGARLIRNSVSVMFDARGAECVLNGLYLADGRQHMDNHLRVEHGHSGGTSRQYYKGVLNGRARTVFDGRVVVHRDAQKTDARQSNHNLVLSRDAEADAKPQLEIYADDVKCAHGCTVGQLDEDALFYLRSRGVAESDAQGMLIRGFAADVLEGMQLEPFRRMVENRLEEYLR